MKKIFLFVLWIPFAAYTFGQSTVTIAKFYDNYLYDLNVQNTSQHGQLDGNAAHYLMDPNIGLEYKAAVINALVDAEKKYGASTFAQYLGRKYGTTKDNLDYSKLTGDELFSLGYLTLIDHDGDPSQALPILEKAKNSLPGSLTVNLIYALAQAQDHINKGENCEAWLVCNTVMNNKSLINDLSVSATEIIIDAVKPYQSACN
ncbi:MAG: hypothetical protein JW731_13110 [Bacteroidales bacterium]|nr:hypothetical protein [Bacteroidales bacterium]